MKKPLTPTEKTVVHKLAKGLPRSVICQHLHITESTLSVHIHNICRKAGIPGLPQRPEQIFRKFAGHWDHALSPSPLLTPSMWETLKLRANGASLAQIAQHRHTAVSTVGCLLSQGFSRLGMKGKSNQRLSMLRETLHKLEQPPSPMDDPAFR